MNKEKPDGEQQSEEVAKFKAAMKEIGAVKKIDIVDDLPKMFRERKPVKKRMPKKRS